MKLTFRIFVLAICAYMVLPALSGPAPSQAADPGQKREIEKIVRDYLLAHPEVIVDAMKNLESRRLAEKRREALKAVSNNRRQLVSDSGDPVTGDLKGDVTLVEFFDYRCGVCRRVHPIVQKLMKDDGKIRRVYKEWPILGPVSVFAARAALASRRQGKYLKFHNALMESSSGLTEASILTIAEQVGLDRARLVRDMRRPDVERVISRNFALADKLKLNGTPSFVIGDHLLNGGRDLHTMKRLIADTRAKNAKK